MLILYLKYTPDDLILIRDFLGYFMLVLTKNGTFSSQIFNQLYKNFPKPFCVEIFLDEYSKMI